MASAHCWHCRGLATRMEPVYVLRRIVTSDCSVRLLLHERCIGTWLLRNPAHALQATDENYPTDTTLVLRAASAPSCEDCGALAFALYVTFDSRPSGHIFLCTSCGGHVVPGKGRRALALFTTDEDAIPVSHEQLGNITDLIALGVTFKQDFTHIESAVRRQVLNA